MTNYHLTFAESALYLASRNNNNRTTEWTTNKRHISAGKSVGIKRLQKKARRSHHPDHFYFKLFCFKYLLFTPSVSVLEVYHKQEKCVYGGENICSHQTELNLLLPMLNSSDYCRRGISVQ